MPLCVVCCAPTSRTGIVFLDEIDKIMAMRDHQRARDIGGEGVQQVNLCFTLYHVLGEGGCAWVGGGEGGCAWVGGWCGCVCSHVLDFSLASQVVSML